MEFHYIVSEDRIRVTGSDGSLEHLETNKITKYDPPFINENTLIILLFSNYTDLIRLSVMKITEEEMTRSLVSDTLGNVNRRLRNRFH